MPEADFHQNNIKLDICNWFIASKDILNTTTSHIAIDKHIEIDTDRIYCDCTSASTNTTCYMDWYKDVDV